MNIITMLATAAKSLAKNKMRSLLTMLGIIIGIASVVAMIAIGQGVQKQIESNITNLGTNMLTIFPGASQQGGVSYGQGTYSRLTYDDVIALKDRSSYLAGVTPVLQMGVQAIGGTGNWSTRLQGVSPDFFAIRDWPVSDGAIFTDDDMKKQNKVCVLGSTVANALFPDGNAVGQSIRIKNASVKIIGVLVTKGSGSSFMDQDDVIVVPFTTAQYRLSNGRFINQIICSAISKDYMEKAQQEITQILRQMHKLSDSAPDDFTIRNQADIIATAQQTTATFTAFLAAIAGISLIVGGIGIMNIMLVSVVERTREIGLRMAVGARRKDILLQFLIEAIMLCLSGGTIGILLGIGVIFLLKNVAHMSVIISGASIVVSFLFSAVVGVAFGYYPALRASKLNPIDALRYE